MLIQTTLSACMIRRLKGTTLSECQIPPRHFKLVKLQLGAPERKLYDALETRMTEALDLLARVAEANGLEFYNTIFVMLLRLRQGSPLLAITCKSRLTRWTACDHPRLVTKDVNLDLDAFRDKSEEDHGELEDLAAEELEAGRCTLCRVPCVAILLFLPFI